MSSEHALARTDARPVTPAAVPPTDSLPPTRPSGPRGTAAEAVIRTIVAHPAFGDGAGFHFLSGNTGSNEGPLWQAIQDVTGLKGLVHGATEFVAFLMASGFEVLANADGDAGMRKIPVLGLHAQVGVKYGAAGLDFMVRQRQPCLLLVGDAGRLARRHGGHNSVPDYAGMLGQLGVKSVYFPVEEDGPSGLVPATREAMAAVLRQPYGPVALILDEDVLNSVAAAPSSGEQGLPPADPPDTRELSEAAHAALGHAADLLARAERPVFVLNQEVGRSPGAREAAEGLARLTGARVVACYAPGTIFDRAHPSWCGNVTFGEAEGIAREIASFDPDTLLVAGGPYPNNVWPNGQSEVPAGVPAIVISPDATDRTRCNMVADAFVQADVGVALSRLVLSVGSRRTDAQTGMAHALLQRTRAENEAALAARIASYERRIDETPIHPARIARDLAIALRTRAEAGELGLGNVAIFDEALTSSPAFVDYVAHFDLNEIFYYGTPGPTLGAHGGSLGFQAARPSGLVVSLFGDGGADFCDAAFIVAARERLPVKHLLIDNGGYELVSVNFARDARLRGEGEADQLLAGQVRPLHTQRIVHQNRAHQVKGFVARETGEPVFGSAYVERPEEVAPAIDAMLRYDGPFLLQVIAQGTHFQPPVG